MKTQFLLLSLLAVGIVLAQSDDSSEEKQPEEKVVKPWKKHDFKKLQPDFLKDLSKDAKTAYFGIKFNPELTKAEKTEQLKDWAKKYEVEEEMQKFLDDKEAECDKKKQERKENYERLGELIEKADAILDDDSITMGGAFDKLEALVQEENRFVQKAFQSFYPFIGRDHEGPRHGHGHGHRFHHGKRFGRHIGHGASPNHGGIGHGAGPRNDGYGAYGNAGLGQGVAPKHDGHHHNKHHKDYKPYGF